jgi:hypothetical protein
LEDEYEKLRKQLAGCQTLVHLRTDASVAIAGRRQRRAVNDEPAHAWHDLNAGPPQPSPIATECHAIDKPSGTTFTFASVDVPGASNTLATCINARGSIVGIYFDSAGNEHGFLAAAGSLVPF